LKSKNEASTVRGISLCSCTTLERNKWKWCVLGNKS